MKQNFLKQINFSIANTIVGQRINLIAKLTLRHWAICADEIAFFIAKTPYFTILLDSYTMF